MNPGTSRPYSGANRRAHQRFTLARRMAYRILDESSQSNWKQGTVVDMSATGVRLEGSGPLPVGASIQMVMDWPGTYHNREEVRLFLSGTVCRSGANGIAMRILDHDFRYAPVAVPNRFRPSQSRRAVA